jgi:NADH-quinone oxidoreductase subunit J
MTVPQILFLATGAVTLIAAVMVVTSPRLVHAGLWLILALAGMAVLFVLLENGFLAVVQVAIYIDAIAILIIITVMLTRAVMRETEQQINRMWALAGLGAFLLFAGLMSIGAQLGGTAPSALSKLPDPETGLELLGRSLVDVDAFILPFEVASILLVAALIGSIVVAMLPPAGVGPQEGR